MKRSPACHPPGKLQKGWIDATGTFPYNPSRPAPLPGRGGSSDWNYAAGRTFWKWMFQIQEAFMVTPVKSLFMAMFLMG